MITSTIVIIAHYADTLHLYKIARRLITVATYLLCYSELLAQDSLFIKSRDERIGDSTFKNSFTVFNELSNNVWDIYSCKFRKDFGLSGNIFNKEIHLNNDTFFSNTSIVKTSFLGDADFSKNVFKSNGNCEKTNFQKGFSARGSEFHCNFDFYLDTFRQYADFSDLKVYDNAIVDFSYSTLPPLISVCHCKIYSGIINFAKINSFNNNKVSYLNIYRSDIENINFEYTHFRFCFFDIYEKDDSLQNLISVFPPFYDNIDSVKKLLYKSDYFNAYITLIFPTIKDKNNEAIDIYVNNSIKTNFFPKALTNDEISSIYESALKNLEKNGQKISYQNLDIEVRTFKDHSPYKWMSSLNKWWWNFGYSKEKIFVHSIFFLLLFTAITFCILSFLQTQVYELPTLARKLKEEPGILSKPTIRLWYSFIYSSMLFFLFSLDMGNFKFSSKFHSIAGTLYVICIYSVGVACIAYMANFVLQK